MRYPLALTSLLLLLLPAGLMAQEMSFEPEAVDEPAPPATPAADPGAPRAAGTEQSRPRAVVLVIRSGEAEPEFAQLITESLTKQVRATGKVEVMPSEDFHVRLFAPGERAAQDCATNAVCVSGFGKELWLDRVVMGVLYKGESGGYTLNVDLIGVERAEVQQYVNRDLRELASMNPNALDKKMAGVVFKLFGLRDPSLGTDGPRTRLVARTGPVQKGLAWSAGGLAGVALVTGLVLGAQARGIQSDLENDQSITQREADTKVDDGETKALTAYMCFAAAGVLAVTSATLFLIKPMQEVKVDESGPAAPGFESESASSSVVPFLIPTLAPEHAGVTLGLRF